LSLEGRGGEGKKRRRQRREEGGEKGERGKGDASKYLGEIEGPVQQYIPCSKNVHFFYFAVDFTDINRFS